jgi:polar amino acid transport system substrate-binding protein
MRRMRSLFVGLAILLAAALFAAGCGDDNGGGGGKKFGTISSGKLKVGSDIPYAPFELGRAPNYKGFDVEFVTDIGKRLKLDATFVKTPFDTIFRDLAQGKFDMVASASTITEERKKTVDFSSPYFAADQSLMIKKGSDIKTVADLKGQVIGAQLGTTGADYAKKETDAKTVRTYDLIDDAFNALQSGQVAAVINDCPVSKYAERSKSDLKVVARIETGENYGLVFRKGSDKLREAVNGAIADTKKDGTFDRIFRKWIGTDPCRNVPAG